MLVILGAAWFLLFDSDQPKTIAVEDDASPVPARVPVPVSKAVASVKDAPPTQESEVILFAPWGDAPGELGRKTPEEGAPEGPMSFVVSEDGRVYLLDQVNQRVQIFKDGKAAREIKIPGDTFQDIAVDPNGRIVLLDRLVQKALVYLDPEQRVLLEGPRVPEGGGVTGLFVNDGAWVEVEHQKLVRIADASGKADPERPWVPGRHSMDGASLLSAALEGRKAAVISVRPIDSTESPIVLRVEFPQKILFLTALESDPEGLIYLGARLEKSEVLVILASDGSEQARIALPASSLELEQFRAVRMGRDGGVYLLHCAGPGATLRRIVW